MSGFPAGVTAVSRARLRDAMLFSLTLHGLVMFGLSSRIEDPQALAPVRSALRAVIVVRQDEAAAVDRHSPIQPTPLLHSTAASPPVAPEPRNVVSDRSSDPIGPAAARAIAAVPAQDSVVATRVIEPRDGYEGEDLRQYKLALAMQARRFKSYPVLAGERGWVGTTEVTVNLSPETEWPSVALEKTSGLSAVDELAVEMIRRASRAAPIPSGLQQRPLRFVLPVRFSLED